jgi:hypothetical protein
VASYSLSSQVLLPERRQSLATQLVMAHGLAASALDTAWWRRRRGVGPDLLYLRGGPQPAGWPSLVAVVLTTRRHLPVRCARGGGRSRERGGHSTVTKGGLPGAVDTDQRVPQDRVPGGHVHTGSMSRAKRRMGGPRCAGKEWAGWRAETAQALVCLFFPFSSFLSNSHFHSSLCFKFKLNSSFLFQVSNIQFKFKTLFKFYGLKYNSNVDPNPNFIFIIIIIILFYLSSPHHLIRKELNDYHSYLSQLFSNPCLVFKFPRVQINTSVNITSIVYNIFIYSSPC